MEIISDVQDLYLCDVCMCVFFCCFFGGGGREKMGGPISEEGPGGVSTCQYASI